MSDIADLFTWFDAKVAEAEKAEDTRKLIQAEQRKMVKTHNAVDETKLARRRAVTLTDDEWRILLTSGKSRRQIVKETGCIDRTLRNRAQLLNLPLPPFTCRPQLTQ